MHGLIRIPGCEQPFWTAEKEAELKRLHSLNVTPRQIAVQFNCTRNAILGKIHRMGLSTSRAWTAERVARAKEYSAMGLSYKEICQKPDMPSWYAVATKLKRMGLGHGDQPSRERRRAFKRTLYTPQPRKQKPSPASLPLPATIASDPRILLDLTKDRCRYPLWPETATSGLYCGASTGNSPYCPGHHAICFTRRA